MVYAYPSIPSISTWAYRP